jgi:branched-chain amino acid transport system substrate-binding protein
LVTLQWYPRAGYRRLVILLSCIVALLLAGCSSSGGSGGSSSNASAPYKIGFIDTLSGSLAFAGLPLEQGAQAAVKWINNHGGVNGRRLDLVLSDDQGNPSVGRSDASSLARQGVVAITGFILSAVYSAVAPANVQLKVPMIAYPFNELQEQPAGDGKYIFTADANQVSQEQPAIFKFAQTLVHGPQRLAILWSSNSTESAAMKQLDIQLAEKLGWKVVTVQGYDPAETSWSAQNAALVAAHPTTVVASISGPPEVAALAALKSAGNQAPAINYDVGTFQSTFGQLNDPNVYGATGWYFPDQTQYSGAADFAAAAKLVKVNPNADYVEPGYVEIALIAAALSKCPGSCQAPDLASAFEKVSGFTGNNLFVGPVTYTASNHQGLSEIKFVHYVDGKMATVSS